MAADQSGVNEPSERKTKGRSLDELTKADPCSASFVRLNSETGETVQINMQDTEETLVEIETTLTSAVPDEIRKRVVVARNLIVYAWFCYDFLAVSMFWGLSCIERALRAKFEEINPGLRGSTKSRGFQTVLEWASKKQLLPEGVSPDAIRKLRNSIAHPRDFNMVVPPGMAIEVFALLIRIVTRLWPMAVASEPAEKQPP